VGPGNTFKNDSRASLQRPNWTASLPLSPSFSPYFFFFSPDFISFLVVEDL
jgi:hypothetical protein